MNEARIAIVVLCTLLVCVFQLKFNTKKYLRICQLPLVMAAFVIMIIGVLIWAVHIEAAANVCGSLEFFTNADLAFVNLSLLLGFCLLRLGLVPLCSRLFGKKGIPQWFSLGFYEYDEEYDKWFLRKQWINFRKYFFALVCGLYLISCAFMAATWIGGTGSDVWILFFPCAALTVANEIYNFINGQTKTEFEHSILGFEADSRREGSYYKLREVLEQILPEPLLSSYTGCEFIGNRTSADLIKMLRESDDKCSRIVAEFFEADDRYKTADVDSVNATLKLMNRRNVVFLNPFYRDLGMYIILPLTTALLAGKKCLILCGRMSVTDDVQQWISQLLGEYSHVRSLWRVRHLSEKEPECDIGIMRFAQLYDKRLINTNRNFLSNTDFVLILEPSLVLSTGQVTLSIIADEIRQNNDEEPVYCICDRNTDGLVDTMSHLLNSEITDVVAMPVPRCTYTAMSWDADGDFSRQRLFDKQTRYLGNGMELAAIAIKNQIPRATWYGESKAPVKDIKWITGQHYATICRYMNLPCQQQELYEKIEFLPNLWNAGKDKEAFIIAEDEFCNMFSMMRLYLSRGQVQTFVNVLSENYLLRDYMRCNRQLFMSNPNAIPSYVPDYSKTERNTILRLIIMMTLHPVSEEEVTRELHLVGIETEDAFGEMSRLLEKYTFADNSIFTVQSRRTAINDLTVISNCSYMVTEEKFDKYFSDSLKDAYYIVEEEKDEEEYIDAKLFSHVTQTILEGQFVTYDGKYYMVKHISPQSGVVLRRASNQFDGRKYYRQIRKYVFDTAAKETVSAKTIGDLEFTEIRLDFHVETSGYLEMSDAHNLRSAKVVDLSGDPAIANYERRYRNKSVLKVSLPHADKKLRFTICMLLSEVFKTAFPDGWPYLAVVSRQGENIEGMLNYMVHPVEGDMDEECIYIIEDSDIDLGLLSNVEKNFTRFMEIISDFLDWHYEKMRESPSQDPIPVRVAAIEREEAQKRSLVVRLLDRIRKLFKRDKAEEKVEIPPAKQAENTGTAEAAAGSDAAEPDVNEVSQEAPGYELEPQEEETGNIGEIAPEGNGQGAEYSLDDQEEPTVNSPGSYINDQPQDDPVAGAAKVHEFTEEDFLVDGDPDLAAMDGTDIFDNSGMPEENDYLESCFMAMGLIPITKSRYQKECFLKFGFEEIDDRIRVDELRSYLRVRGWSNNYLTLARKRDVLDKNIIDLNAVNHCDFCGLPLSGISYERLNDGRIRCNDCSRSAISNIADLRELFYRTLHLMEDFFDIRYRIPINVIMADARTVGKASGMLFRPSTQMSSRVLGFAQKKRGQYNLVMENGSPRLAFIDTMVHEMTHIWQYLNWNDQQIRSIYGMNKPKCTSIACDIVYEGMAMWASIQYLYQIGETYYAAKREAVAELREDIYGIGFRLYREQYPFVKDTSLLKYSPFQSFPPLEPGDVTGAVRSRCTEDECKC